MTKRDRKRDNVANAGNRYTADDTNSSLNIVLHTMWIKLVIIFSCYNVIDATML